jgi:hypothetical protein
MGIGIPKRLNDHLLKDNHWYGCVTSSKSKIEYFLSESPLFFPDYTGHGIDHISNVILVKFWLRKSSCRQQKRRND